MIYVYGSTGIIKLIKYIKFNVNQRFQRCRQNLFIPLGKATLKTRHAKTKSKMTPQSLV